jgi:hypothetical protein
MEPNQNEKLAEWFVFYCKKFTLKVTFVGWALISCFVLALFPTAILSALSGFHAFGVLSLAAFGCFAVGGILGFIFAIPRALQMNDHEGTPKSKWGHNTNLEQVSDWLVKALIGASLVRLESIKMQVIKLSERLCETVPQLGHTHFALFLIIYYFILGFIGVYLLTRFEMIRALKHAEEDLKEQFDRIKDIEFRDRVVSKYEHFLNLSKTDLSYSTTKTRIFGDLKKALEIDPSDRYAVIPLAHLLSVDQKYDEAIACLNSTLEFRRKNRGMKEDVDDAAMLFNIACYQNRIAEGLPPNDSASENLRKTAWENLKKSIRLDPLNKDEANMEPDLETLLKVYGGKIV